MRGVLGGREGVGGNLWKEIYVGELGRGDGWELDGECWFMSGRGIGVEMWGGGGFL